jgi:calcyclin binding protein
MDKKDPMSGIMDLMKVSAFTNSHHLIDVCDALTTCYMDSHMQNMYEEGDEDMKRTIAKAWSDARSGKAADPMKGLP